MKRGGQMMQVFGPARWYGEALFGIDNALIGSWPVEKQPRGMAISADGRWLVVSGEKSAVIGSYAIEARSGALQRVGEAPAGRDANWVTIVSY